MLALHALILLLRGFKLRRHDQLSEALSKRVVGVGQLGEWAVTDAEERSRN